MKKIDCSLQRQFWAVYADDLRQEVDGKVTIVGAYQSEMIFQQLPAVLPKLGILLTAYTPAEKPFKKLVFEIYKDEELIDSIDLSSETSKGAEYQMAAILGPLNIAAPCVLRCLLITESESIIGRTLKISSIASLAPRL